MEKLSEVLKRTLRELEHKMNMNNKESNKMNEGATTTKPAPRVVDLTGTGFLRRKGLKRDQANYVTMLIRMKADLTALLKITNDVEVQDELVSMIGFMQETIDFIYMMDEVGGGSDNAA